MNHFSRYARMLTALLLVSHPIAAESYVCEFVLMRADSEETVASPGLFPFSTSSSNDFDEEARAALRSHLTGQGEMEITTACAPSLTVLPAESSTIEVSNRIPIPANPAAVDATVEYRNLGQKITVEVVPVAGDERITLSATVEETRIDDSLMRASASTEMLHPLINTSKTEFTCVTLPGQATLLVSDSSSSASPVIAFRVTPVPDLQPE